MDSIYNNGSKAIITWEPWGIKNTDISSGQKDNHIRQMASDTKACNKEIYISLMHEANGNWYDWAIGDSKVNNNQTYKAAYQHVVNIFRQVGANNVKFIWNVNAGNCGSGTSYTDHYPGDTYVDYVAIDGYNWGTTQSWGSTWQSFDEIFAAPYQALSTINKPIFITEFSSTEIGGNKAAWITETFKTIRTKYPRIKLVSWFGENKETDWRINSSAASLAAFRAAVKGGTTVVPSPSPSQAVVSSTQPSIAPTPSQAPAGQSINQTYTITANGSNAIDLSKLTIRYTFSKSDSKNMNAFCDNAAAQLSVAPYCQSLNANTSIKKDGGNYVLEITFKNAFTLKPQTGSVQVQIRMANDDWLSIGTGFTDKGLTVLY
nr:glycosyl hydrolase [uncultured Lachnoclostridium sp.]